MLYLQEALPRLYNDVQGFLAARRPELLLQLRYLYVNARCQCGAQECPRFTCESDLFLGPLAGRECAYQLTDCGDAAVKIGVTPLRIITGFIVIWDYSDGYISQRLGQLDFEHPPEPARSFLPHRLRPPSISPKSLR